MYSTKEGHTKQYVAYQTNAFRQSVCLFVVKANETTLRFQQARTEV